MPGPTDVIAWGGLVVLAAAVAAIDLRTQRIPNLLNGALLLGGVAASALTARPGLAASAGGAALGGLFLLGVAVGFRRLRGRDGLGLGDVKFLVGAGAWVGWQGIGPLVFVAAVAALLVTGGRALGGAVDRHARIPFGPYLALALVVVRAWQEASPAAVG